MDLLVEKYRPNTLEDVILSDELRTKFSEYIEKKSIPHILLNGAPGIGKTTLAKILAKSITEDYLFICSSDHNSIDDIRGKVKGFCSTISFSGIKIIILDECDAITFAGQSMLRNLMEEFADHSRFILTCNFGEKIMDAIKSRCTPFDLITPSMKSVALRCYDILNKEGVIIDNKEDIKLLVKKYYPDIRKVINNLQRMIVDNHFKFVESSQITNQDALIKLLKEGNFTQITKEILTPGCDYITLYRTLFDRSSEVSPERSVEVMLIVGEFHKYHSMVIDTQLHFRTCLLNIAKIIFK
jgi:DNA polymerase III delta prime subunit